MSHVLPAYPKFLVQGRLLHAPHLRSFYLGFNFFVSLLKTAGFCHVIPYK